MGFNSLPSVMAVVIHSGLILEILCIDHATAKVWINEIVNLWYHVTVGETNHKTHAFQFPLQIIRVVLAMIGCTRKFDLMISQKILTGQ